MKRLTPDTGPSDGLDPDSPEGLRRAEEDRLTQMAVYGLTEEDFGDSVIPVIEDEEDAEDV